MLSGKLALITGAGSGIGLQTAKTFAKEGAICIIADLQDSCDNILKELHNDSKTTRHSYFKCDVTKSDDVTTLFNNIQACYPEFGVPNVIVNNAGIYIGKLLVDLSENDYDRVMNVNVKGTFLVTQEAVKRLIEKYPNVKLEALQTYASIINISSLAGKNGCREETHYAASKAAVEGFTRSCAKELGAYQIRCNAILPGLIRTPMLMRESRRQHVQNLASMTTLGRIGEPSEVANVCLFLASDLSSYLNGASIDVNGGLAF